MKTKFMRISNYFMQASDFTFPETPKPCILRLEIIYKVYLLSVPYPNGSVWYSSFGCVGDPRVRLNQISGICVPFPSFQKIIRLSFLNWKVTHLRFLFQSFESSNIFFLANFFLYFSRILSCRFSIWIFATPIFEGRSRLRIFLFFFNVLSFLNSLFYSNACFVKTQRFVNHWLYGILLNWNLISEINSCVPIFCAKPIPLPIKPWSESLRGWRDSRGFLSSEVIPAILVVVISDDRRFTCYDVEMVEVSGVEVMVANTDFFELLIRSF